MNCLSKTCKIRYGVRCWFASEEELYSVMLRPMEAHIVIMELLTF